MRILLVEDDLMLGKALKNTLANENNVVDWVTESDSCEAAIATTRFDVILLDVNLPHKSGLEILQNLRSNKNNTPVIILTARDAVSQKIEGLDLGADDYLAKPFIVEELLARIRSITRRSKGLASPIIKCGSVDLDPKNFIVTKDNKEIDLIPKEFNILKALVENQGKIVSKSHLEEILYSWEDNVESNTVEVYIHRLRKKLGQNFIKTARGFGYKIDKD